LTAKIHRPSLRNWESPTRPFQRVRFAKSRVASTVEPNAAAKPSERCARATTRNILEPRSANRVIQTLHPKRDSAQTTAGSKKPQGCESQRPGESTIDCAPSDELHINDVQLSGSHARTTREKIPSQSPIMPPVIGLDTEPHPDRSQRSESQPSPGATASKQFTPRSRLSQPAVSIQHRMTASNTTTSNTTTLRQSKKR